MGNLRSAQKQLTRRLLMEAALELFREQGYGATKVDDIAGAAGTTRVAFYAYFPSKSDLMRALIDEELNDVLKRSRSSEHGSTAMDLVDAVAIGTRSSLGSWLRGRVAVWPQIRPILTVGREAAVIDPDLGDQVERWMEEAISDVRDGLDKAGRFDPSVRHFRGVLAMAALDYVAERWVKSSQWGVDTEQMLAELTEQWVTLLGEPD